MKRDRRLPRPDMKNPARQPEFPQVSQEFMNGIRHNEEICCWLSWGWDFVDVLIRSRRIGGPAKCVKAGGLTAPPGRGSVPPNGLPPTTAPLHASATKPSFFQSRHMKNTVPSSSWSRDVCLPSRWLYIKTWHRCSPREHAATSRLHASGDLSHCVLVQPAGQRLAVLEPPAPDDGRLRC